MEMTSTLTVTPHPLTLAGQRHIAYELVLGETLGEFLRRHVDNMDSGAWIVTIGGYEVPAKLWDKTFPKHGTVIECRSVVQKQALAIVAIIAIAYFAPYLGGAAAGAFGGSAAAWTAAITIAGSMIVNKVLGPKQTDPSSLKDSDASSTYKIGGGRNRARPYEPLGLLFGELRITPDLASLPFTWFQGGDQYLYQVFHSGINTHYVTEVRIGQTPITNYADMSMQERGFSGMTDKPLEAWSNVDTIAGAELIGLGDYVTRTSSADTVAIQCDFEGTLYMMSDTGELKYGTMTIGGEYRLLPGGNWQQFPFPDSQFFATENNYEVVDGRVQLLYTAPSSTNWNILNNTTKPIRRSVTVVVPRGQYEVRFRKASPDAEGIAGANKLTWSQLKSIGNDDGTYGKMGRLGLTIKASGQLNGTIDEMNWKAVAHPMDYWDGSSWQLATTRANGLSNPGAQILYFARGIRDYDGKLVAGLGLLDSQIDIEALKGFMVRCAAKGFTFDYYLDAAMNCGDVLDAIAAVGLGSITWQSGKLGVVWAAEDQPVEGVVNMATMKAKTFSVSYQTLDTADSLEYA